MAKFIRSIFKTDTLSLTECNDGFYLYDYVLGMNISMRAKTEQAAFIESLTYYQKSLKESQIKFNDINTKVENFVSQFNFED